MSAEDGDALFGTLVSNQGVSSNDEITPRRIESVDKAEEEEVVRALEG